MKRLFSVKVSTKNNDQVSFNKKVIKMQSWFHLLKHIPPLTQILTLGNKYFLHHQVIGKVFPHNYIYNGVTYRNFCDVGMKWRAMKAKQNSSFLLYAKNRKGFSKINDGVKSFSSDVYYIKPTCSSITYCKWLHYS